MLSHATRDRRRREPGQREHRIRQDRQDERHRHDYLVLTLPLSLSPCLPLSLSLSPFLGGSPRLIPPTPCLPVRPAPRQPPFCRLLLRAPVLSPATSTRPHSEGLLFAATSLDAASALAGCRDVAPRALYHA